MAPDVEATWIAIHREWVAAGKPADIPPVELALLKLVDLTEADGWRARELLARDQDLLDAAATLIRLLRLLGLRVYLRDNGTPAIAGARHLWAPYEPELQMLRPSIEALLRSGV